MNMGYEAYNSIFLIGFSVAMITVIGVILVGYKMVKDKE